MSALLSKLQMKLRLAAISFAVLAISAPVSARDNTYLVGPITEVRDDGRVVLLGHPYLFYAALLPSQSCRIGEIVLSCRDLALPFVRAALVGKTAKYETNAMIRGQVAVRSAEVADLVRAGWLVADEEEGVRLYEKETATAKGGGRGVWGMIDPPG